MTWLLVSGAEAVESSEQAVMAPATSAAPAASIADRMIVLVVVIATSSCVTRLHPARGQATTAWRRFLPPERPTSGNTAIPQRRFRLLGASHPDKRLSGGPDEPAGGACVSLSEDR